MLTYFLHYCTHLLSNYSGRYLNYINNFANWRSKNKYKMFPARINDAIKSFCQREIALNYSIISEIAEDFIIEI